MTRSLVTERPAGSRPESRQDSNRRTRVRQRSWDLLLVIAVGGALGATARYGLGQTMPAPPGAFPWATFTINVVGCLLIGILMVLITQVWEAHRLVRPFLGVGVLGGFTTFSSYVVDIQRLVDAKAAGVSLAYLAGTPVSALAATGLGVVLTRRVAAAAGYREAS